jgi:hypothetical protein
MLELDTIQRREKLNKVFAEGKKGNGNAYHTYTIHLESLRSDDNKPVPCMAIEFQNGGRKIPNSSHGVTGEDLLEIVRHRLQCFQTSEYACRENACALTHIEEALMWLNKRVEDRLERGVLGINSK